MEAKRDEWKAERPKLDPARPVFVDETWANTNMSRACGRSPKGVPPVRPVPHSHRKTTAFAAALRADGMTAPVVIDGARTGDLFVARVERILVPTLRPGDAAVVDNPVCHKRPARRGRSRRPGASCGSCRRTAPTSIPSSWRSRS